MDSCALGTRFLQRSFMHLKISSRHLNYILFRPDIWRKNLRFRLGCRIAGAERICRSERAK
jgi:hypothetical protein